MKHNKQLIAYFLYQLLILNILQLLIHFIAPGHTPLWLLPAGLVITSLIRSISGTPSNQIIVIIAGATYGAFVGFVEYDQLANAVVINAALAGTAMFISHNAASYYQFKSLSNGISWFLAGTHVLFQVLYLLILWDWLSSVPWKVITITALIFLPMILEVMSTTIALRISYRLTSKFPGKHHKWGGNIQLGYFFIFNLALNVSVAKLSNPTITNRLAIIVGLSMTAIAVMIVTWFRILSESKPKSE